MIKLVVILGLLLLAVGCGGDKSPSTSGAGAGAGAETGKKHKAPAMLPDHFDDATAKAALDWLETVDLVAIEEVPNLRLPSGGVRSVTALDAASFYTYIYDKAPRDQGAYALLTLLDEDGWKIADWKRTESGAVMFSAVHDNRLVQMLAGAPTGKESTSSTLGFVLPKVAFLGRPVTPVAVKALWNKDTQGSPAHLLRTYGKLGFVRYDDGEASQGWSTLDKLQPSQAQLAGPEPLEKCGVATGDKVRSPFSLSKMDFPAKIGETYGGVAFVKFDDGDQHWVECERIRKL
jgi:hypothetical protein